MAPGPPERAAAHVRAHGRGQAGPGASGPASGGSARECEPGRKAKSASSVPVKMIRIKQIEIPSKAEITAHPSQRKNSGRASTDNMKKDPVIQEDLCSEDE
jgi:hypothetical protein